MSTSTPSHPFPKLLPPFSLKTAFFTTHSFTPSAEGKNSRNRLSDTSLNTSFLDKKTILSLLFTLSFAFKPNRFFESTTGYYDLFTASLTLSGLLLLLKNKPLSAALLIGIAAATKFFPLIFFPLPLLFYS